MLDGVGFEHQVGTYPYENDRSTGGGGGGECMSQSILNAFISIIILSNKQSQ